MKVFQMIYVSDLSLKLLQTLTEICDKEGLTVHESTLRWMMHHSSLQKEDGIILGGSSEEQMEQNLKACEEGPLPKTIVDCFEDMCQEYQGAGKGLIYSV
jgi:aflatoxin B1 aldehyde reductase